MITSTLFQP